MVIKLTVQADRPQATNDHTSPQSDQPAPRRPWHTPRLERAGLSATRFGVTGVFDGVDVGSLVP